MTRLLALLCALLALAGDARADSFALAVPNAAPVGAATSTGLVYASAAPVVINSSMPTSVFPPGSAPSRTLPANTLTPGRSFALIGGGVYTAPVGNTLSADITLKVGAATVVSITTPAVLVATNQGIDFHAVCTVYTATTMACTGVFLFAVLGSNPVVVPFNSVTARTFDPTTADLIDVLGDWNGTTTTHATTVQTAALLMLN